MTFVDQGVIALDDDIARWLPEFAGSNPPITARQLLDAHVGGARTTRARTTAPRSRRASARSRRRRASSPPGSSFSYGNSPFLVVGRLIEVLGESRLRHRRAATHHGSARHGRHSLARCAGGCEPRVRREVTVDDYGKFLDMILHDGVANGTRVLSSDAVAQMITDQVSHYDTSQRLLRRHHGDPALRPRLLARRPGLSLAQTAVVSGNGGKGFYPWVDFTTRDLGHRRRAGRTRRAVGGPGVTTGRGRSAHGRSPVNRGAGASGHESNPGGPRCTTS